MRLVTAEICIHAKANIWDYWRSWRRTKASIVNIQFYQENCTEMFWVVGIVAAKLHTGARIIFLSINSICLKMWTLTEFISNGPKIVRSIWIFAPKMLKRGVFNFFFAVFKRELKLLALLHLSNFLFSLFYI